MSARCWPSSPTGPRPAEGTAVARPLHRRPRHRRRPPRRLRPRRPRRQQPRRQQPRPRRRLGRRRWAEPRALDRRPLQVAARTPLRPSPVRRPPSASPVGPHPRGGRRCRDRVLPARPGAPPLGRVRAARPAARRSVVDWSVVDRLAARRSAADRSLARRAERRAPTGTGDRARVACCSHRWSVACWPRTACLPTRFGGPAQGVGSPATTCWRPLTHGELVAVRARPAGGARPRGPSQRRQ
jgi:hypothetical protein